MTKTSHDLNTRDGLQAAVDEAGSFAELPRKTGTAESTLKTRAKKLGVTTPTRPLARHENLPATAVALPPVSRAARVGESNEVLDEVASRTRAELDDFLDGSRNDLDYSAFMYQVEVHTPLAAADHDRLIRAAQLALAYWSRSPRGGSKRDYIKRVAAACRVDPEALKSYIDVVAGELRPRRGSGTAVPVIAGTGWDDNLSSPEMTIEELRH
jgi:hypothetical protein